MSVALADDDDVPWAADIQMLSSNQCLQISPSMMNRLHLAKPDKGPTMLPCDHLGANSNSLLLRR
jgi:hypothetical protein